MNVFARAANAAQPVALLLARILAGVVFFWHGLSKFRNGLDGVEAMFDTWGVPAPALSALVVAVVELIGGIGLIVGLGTRIWALLLAIVMIGALGFVKGDMGITGGANTDLGLLAAMVPLVAYGAGPVSADAALELESSEVAAHATA